MNVFLPIRCNSLRIFPLCGKCNPERQNELTRRIQHRKCRTAQADEKPRRSTLFDMTSLA
jgi:hypothetical protein